MFAVGLDGQLINISKIFFADLQILKFSNTVDYTLSACSLNIITRKPSNSIDEIKQIIFGSLLGDANLELPPRGLNARFGFIQSNKYESYFLFVFDIFSQFWFSSYRSYSYLDKRTGKIYSSFRFWTKALPLFTEFFEQFYVNGIKVVPADLSLLTPLALAHLIMQDGSFSTSKGLYLCTDSFTPEDSIRLAHYINKKFDLKTTNPKAPGNKGSLRIYISATSMENLRALVKPYMHSTMLYKLGQ